MPMPDPDDEVHTLIHVDTEDPEDGRKSIIKKVNEVTIVDVVCSFCGGMVHGAGINADCGCRARWGTALMMLRPRARILW